MRMFAILLLLLSGACLAKPVSYDLTEARYNNGNAMRHCDAAAYKAGRCFEHDRKGTLVILAFELGMCKNKRPEDLGYVLLNTRTKLVTPLDIMGEHCGSMPVPKFDELKNEDGFVEPVIAFFVKQSVVQTFYLD